MKRNVYYTTRFKKDLKRYRNDKERRGKIAKVVKMLSDGAEIPADMRPHPLKGNYSGCMELHIEGDLLLIWLEKPKSGEEDIYLVRIGSHSDLF